MAGIKEIASGRLDIFKVDPRVLQEEPGFNLRQEGPDLDEYIKELAEYIKNKGCPGVLTIHMKDGQPFVIDGHCRRRASLIAIEQGAELQSVPCKMVDRYDNDADKIAYLISTNSGRPLSPLEKASVCKRLHDLGLENKDISIKTGLSISRVGQLLDLLAAPEKVLVMVRKGEVSASMAQAEIKIDPENAANNLSIAIEKAKDDGKKRVTKKHLESDDQEQSEPDVAAFEAMELPQTTQKHWLSFKAGWDAAIRFKKKNRR